MIVNLPTQDGLDNVALQTYFQAWGRLTSIWPEFASYFEPKKDTKDVAKDWPDEWADYLQQSQADLQSVTSLLQQSMELALKARICAVSPYLLILDTGLRLSNSPKNVDFSELRTLDAVDLPGAVNTLTDTPVSDQFIEMYSRLRALRNKIVHLGETGINLNPEKILRDAVSIYIHIWPHRKWLSDRLDFASRTRRGWLHDGRYTSTHMEVLHQWPFDIELVTKGEFKALFGQAKAKRRYLCHSCVSAGETKYSGLIKPDCATAYLNNNILTCLMCSEKSRVERKKCPNCDGDVVGANDDDWVDYCHSCGRDVNEHCPIKEESSSERGFLLELANEDDRT